MNVSACLVTRGDVDMQPILDSLPKEWEKIVWDNSGSLVHRCRGVSKWHSAVPGCSVYGRYAAIEYASHDLIYIADDDCIVSDPQAIVDAWHDCPDPISTVVCNMPAEFRHDGYVEHSLVGFGAAFHRDAPARAFGKFFGTDTGYLLTRDQRHFNRCCDIVFTALTPRVIVDIAKENLSYASDDNRMWKQQGHIEERARMLNLVRSLTAGGTS